MDAVIIAGLSKDLGSQFGLKREHQLVKEGMVMSYGNLRKLFGLSSDHMLDNFTTPYLAGIYLYNYLSRRGVRCGLINFLDLQIKEFKSLLNMGPEVVALSSTFLTSIKAVKKVTSIIRQHALDIKIILGGPLVYNSYVLYKLKDSDYDTDSSAKDYFFLNREKDYYKDIDLFVVEEQGEKTLWRVITAIINGRDYTGIPNIAYYKDDRLVFTKPVPENNDFSDDLIHWDQIPEEYLAPIFPVRGSRGCPYKCKYCNFAPGRSFRLKSPDAISKEIAALANTRKVKMVRFTDDNLFLDRKHLEECCRKIIETGSQIKWSAFIRASFITKENVRLLRDSGCLLALIGIESGDRNILKEMNKNNTPKDYLRAIELLNSRGISTQLCFIIGFPGETPRTIENTVEMVNRFHHEGPAINQIMVFPFVFVPLSPIYEPNNARKYNLKGYMNDWVHDTMNSQEAQCYAREFLERVKNIYPQYGIEEFLIVEITKLKEISRLRHQIRRAERSQASPDTINGYWHELRKVVAG
jgi:p-methyltransferase